MVSSRPASEGSAAAAGRRRRCLRTGRRRARQAGLELGVTVVVAHASSGSSAFRPVILSHRRPGRGTGVVTLPRWPGPTHRASRRPARSPVLEPLARPAPQVREVRRGVGAGRRHQPGRAVVCLVVLDLGGRPSNIIAVTVGSIPNYLINRAWTFNKRGAHSFTREVLPFWGMALLGPAAVDVHRGVGRRAGGATTLISAPPTSARSACSGWRSSSSSTRCSSPRSPQPSSRRSRT